MEAWSSIELVGSRCRVQREWNVKLTVKRRVCISLKKKLTRKASQGSGFFPIPDFCPPGKYRGEGSPSMCDNQKPCRKKLLCGVCSIGTFVEKSDWEDLESRTGLVVRSGILLQFGDLMEKTLEEDAGRRSWEKTLGSETDLTGLLPLLLAIQHFSTIETVNLHHLKGEVHMQPRILP
jgi:hypothetical protein